MVDILAGKPKNSNDIIPPKCISIFFSITRSLKDSAGYDESYNLNVRLTNSWQYALRFGWARL